MKQLWITTYGGPETLQLRETADPTPQNDELRIRVRALGVNFADILARKGLYPDAPKAPCVVGYEIAGTVDAVGPNADKNWLNRNVFGLTRFGGYSDTVVVSQRQVFRMPEGCTYVEAASVPVSYLTAWQLLVVMGALQEDETILIHNAGGGLGLAAIDIARHIGARTIGTASKHKHAFLKERGLDHAIDYTTDDWLPIVQELTDGRGVELIVDPIGGKHWKRSYEALRATGRLGMFGISSTTLSKLPGPLRYLPMVAGLPWFNPLQLMSENRATFGVNLGHMWGETEKIRRWTDKLLAGWSEGWIRPHVDTTFPLDQAGEAHRYIENRQNIGKVVLTVDHSAS